MRRFLSYGMAAFMRVFGMGVDEAREICRGATRATRDKRTHMYGMYLRVWGRRPTEGEVA